MRVVIASASHSAHLSGVERHAINLSRALGSQEEIERVHLVAAPWQKGLFEDALSHEDTKVSLHIARLGRDAFRRNLWYYTQLPELASKFSADIVHLAFPMPLKPSAFHCPTVVSLHDLYPFAVPENFGFPKVLVNRMVLTQCLNAVQAIACVSRSTYSDLFDFDPLLAQCKANVIPNSVEPPSGSFLTGETSRWSDLPFLLCVAQHRRNKNILLALRVFRRLLVEGHIAPKARLIVVGISGPDTSRIKDFIATSGMCNRVVLASGLSDHELQSLYKGCDVLLAPSITEGFGLPVVEGLLAGCRVVCSTIPAHCEFGEGYCHFVTLGPGDEAGFVGSIVAALSETKPAPVTLPHLTSSCIGRSYLDLYRNLFVQGCASPQQSCSFPVRKKGHALP
jgi:glycosyltransferase involved in cell wall biosynthesis